MKPNDLKWVIVGQFGRPHGVKGFVTVHSFTTPPENIIEYRPWYIAMNDTWNELTFRQLSFGSRHSLALVEGYETREAAALLTNCEIGVLQDNFPVLPSGEFYWHELTGLQVINPAGTVFGRVHNLLNTGAHDVLVVEQNGQQRMIPYVLDRIVLRIDKHAGLILVDWEEDY